MVFTTSYLFLLALLCFGNLFSIVNKQAKLVIIFYTCSRQMTSWLNIRKVAVETNLKQLWVKLTQGDKQMPREQSVDVCLVTVPDCCDRGAKSVSWFLCCRLPRRLDRDVTHRLLTSRHSTSQPHRLTARLRLPVVYESIASFYLSLSNRRFLFPATDMDAITFTALNSSVVLLLFRRHDYESNNPQIIVLICFWTVQERWAKVSKGKT